MPAWLWILAVHGAKPVWLKKMYLLVRFKVPVDSRARVAKRFEVPVWLKEL